MNNSIPHYTFCFLYYPPKGKGPEMVTKWRFWGIPLRQAHLLALREAKKRRGSAFVRLETSYKDDRGIRRCYLTDMRCVGK